MITENHRHPNRQQALIWFFSPALVFLIASCGAGPNNNYAGPGNARNLRPGVEVKLAITSDGLTLSLPSCITQVKAIDVTLWLSGPSHIVAGVVSQETNIYQPAPSQLLVGRVPEGFLSINSDQAFERSPPVFSEEIANSAPGTTLVITLYARFEGRDGRSHPATFMNREGFPGVVGGPASLIMELSKSDTVTVLLEGILGDTSELKLSDCVARKNPGSAVESPRVS